MGNIVKLLLTKGTYDIHSTAITMWVIFQLGGYLSISVEGEVLTEMIPRAIPNYAVSSSFWIGYMITEIMLLIVICSVCNEVIEGCKKSNTVLPRL